MKNCNMNFHRYVNNRGLIPPILGLLKRKRKKLSVIDKMTSLYKDPSWRPIEDRVLGMLQLWADTFMMQEDKYPLFMSTYRDLRKEGIQFPPRDPNERYMIKYDGEASPAFELAEMGGGGGLGAFSNRGNQKGVNLVSLQREEKQKNRRAKRCSRNPNCSLLTLKPYKLCFHCLKKA